MNTGELIGNLIIVVFALVIALLIWFDPVGRWYRRRQDRRRNR